MVPGPNFYIHGGGRWREVDINDGRVEGWGRARFVYVKRGKVHTAKTRALLAALRDIKAGKKSAAKDGARLPIKRIQLPQNKGGRLPESRECCCSHCSYHTKNNGCPPTKIVKQSPIKPTIECPSVTKTDASIQTTLPSQTLLFSDPKKDQTNKRKDKTDKRGEKIDKRQEKITKRHEQKGISYEQTDRRMEQTVKKREMINDDVSTSSEENIPTKITTTAMVNSSPHQLSKLKLKKQWSLERSENAPKQKVPSLKLRKANVTKYNLYRRKRSDSRDSIVWVVLPKSKDNDKTEVIYNGKEYQKNESKSMKRHCSSSDSTTSSSRSMPRKIKKNMSAAENASPLYKLKTNNSAPDHVKKKKQVQSEMRISDELKSNPESAQEVDPDKFKELVIEEEDIELLRNYWIKNSPDFDLLRYDADDTYKAQLFYTITPLVNVERCPKIARMIRRDSQSDMSLKDFVSHLGLTAVSEKKIPQRYKMRNRNADRIDDENDKENSSIVIKTGHLRNQKKNAVTKADTESDEMERTPLNTKGQNRDDVKLKMLSNQSVEKKRGTIRKNDVIEIFKSKKRERKSDSDTDETSSEQEPRVLRRSSFTSQGGTSDSGESLKLSNKKSIEKKTNIKTNIKTSSQTNSAKKNEEQTSKRPQTPLQRNDRGQYMKRNTSEKKHIPKLSKDSKSNNKTIKEAKTKRQDKHISDSRTFNSNTVLSSSTENSADEFVSATKITRQNKLSVNKENRKVSKLIESSGEEFEPTKVDISRRSKCDTSYTTSTDENSDTEQIRKESRPTRNHIKRSSRNTRDLNKTWSENNSKSTDDEHTRIKLKSKNNDRKSTTDNVENKLNSTQNDSKKLKLDNAGKTNIFVKPVIEEIKSLAPVSRVKRGIKRPASVESSVQRVEYSNLEDHAIVTWLSNGGRARRVNGNALWRELEGSYENITGQRRSFHSLRNRYLRSILPRLGKLALNPSLVTKLRAAAAAGNFKSRSKSRRNSIFGAPATLAASRAPRPRSPEEHVPAKIRKLHYDDKPSSSSPRELRSSFHSPRKSVPSPRYSGIIRDFASKFREPSPSSSIDSFEGDNPKKTSLKTRKSLETQKSLDSKKSNKKSLETKKTNVNLPENKKFDKSSSETKKSDKSSSETKKSDKSSSETKKSDKSSSETKKFDKSSSETKKSDKSSSETKKSDKHSSEIKKSDKNSSDAKNPDKRISLKTKTPSKGSSNIGSERKINKDSKATTSLVTKSSGIKSPTKGSVKSPEKGRTKMRRLFNPRSAT